jgi:hypothetical protein
MVRAVIPSVESSEYVVARDEKHSAFKGGVKSRPPANNT